MVFRTLLALVVIATTFSAGAQEPCGTKIQTYQEVLRCAEEKSPEVKTARLALERARAQVDAASQWKNPELAAESVYGSSESESISETELSLGFPLELGGKRPARAAFAQGGAAEAEAVLLEAQARVRGAALLKLHRLRQTLHELEVIEESIATFTKLLTQYGRRPKLSPEQELSRAVFRMARSDYELKKTAVLDEVESLDTYLKTNLGTDIESLKKGLPPTPKAWPDLGSELMVTGSPRLKTLAAELQTAQAELSLANSEAWPTLTIGPSLKLQSEAGRSERLYGLNLSFPLPLFNMNGPGRAAATTGVKLAEVRKNVALVEQQRLVEELSRTYKNSVEVLASTLSHQEIEKKHADIERLFLRGTVPSALVIEAHRTFVELEQSRNERELKALEALVGIYTLTGEIPEVTP